MKILIIAAALLLPALPALGADKAPVVIELFTSQSCSSCPPAEEYLGTLTQQDNIIAVRCHVDYWDYLSWKDTFSRDYCSVRQKSYRTSMGTQHIYTPQMVINGREGVNGTDQAAVTQAIAQMAGQPVSTIDLARDDTELRIDMPALNVAGAATIYVFEYAGSGELLIPQGENRGVTMTNTNPVLSMHSIEWDGKAGTITARLDQPDTKVAVIVNREHTGPVIAAGKI